MANRFGWLKLISRVCVLAILSGTLIDVWTGPKVRADSETTCIQCDQNNVNTLSNCSYNRDVCIAQCVPGDSICTGRCDNTYVNCQNGSWNNYDSCLYGWTDFSGLCSVVSQSGYPPPSGLGRTPCDFACRDQMFECRQNGGATCGEEYNDCKLSCG